MVMAGIAVVVALIVLAVSVVVISRQLMRPYLASLQQTCPMKILIRRI